MLKMKKLIEFILSFFRRKKQELQIIDYPKYTIKPFDSLLIKAINDYRELNNLPILEYGCDSCFDVVGFHSSFLAENVKTTEEFKEKGHWYSYQRFNQLKLRDSDALYCGENVSMGYISHKSVLSAWLNSKGHKEILDNHRFSKIVLASKDKFVVTILYGK